MVNLFPSIISENVFNSEELQNLENLIMEQSKLHEWNEPSGKRSNEITAKNYTWKYKIEKNKHIKEIIDSKLESVFGRHIEITDSQILVALLPYKVHTDYVHTIIDGKKPSYSIIIPLQNYNSKTIIFNEYQENSNELEVYKSQFNAIPELRIDPKFCLQNLSHLHPNDLKYLTIKEVFEWKQGSLFAFDRRYFHCSDNFPKKNLQTKKAIVMWAHE